MKPPAGLIPAFQETFERAPTVLARAPGRVNLLGEHVDYNEGWVLPAALDMAAWIAAAPSHDRRVTVHALDLKESASFDLDDLASRLTVEGEPLPGWARYPAGVAWALGQRGLRPAGLLAVLTSSVPIGAGLSSSAAVEAAFAVVWDHLGGWALPRMGLAQLCRRAETAYVGVHCGLMDQFASLHGLADHALLFDCRTLNWEAVPLPAQAVLVIADSGVRRALQDSAYNERRAACERAVALLRPLVPGLRALRDLSPAALREHADVLPPTVLKRAEHVVQECARVLQAADRLRAGDLPGFGQLMLQGHASLRDLYEVSTPELDALVEIATGLPGCYGARLTGAGFGGCTVNLVARAQAPLFSRQLAERYHEHVGRNATVWICRAAQGARAWNTPQTPPE